MSAVVTADDRVFSASIQSILSDLGTPLWLTIPNHTRVWPYLRTVPINAVTRWEFFECDALRLHTVYQQRVEKLLENAIWRGKLFPSPMCDNNEGFRILGVLECV
jgi:hypothetical protein